MFINFWYAAATSDSVKAEPVKVRMLGQNFVLFRDSKGEVHCLSNVCAHRGGSLGDGKTKSDCVECPYHGWQFNGAGECVKIPSIGTDGKIPPRAKIDSYPVQEKYGLVFAFLGDLPEAERPPIMAIDEYGGDGWRATIQNFQWDIDFQRSIENGIDPGHNAFVHDTHISDDDEDNAIVGTLNMVEDEWGTGFWNKVRGQPLRESKMREASGRNEAGMVDAGTGHFGISSVWTHIHPTETMFIHQYLFETPIDAHRTSIWLVNLRNFLIEPEHDARIMQRNEYVALQDRDILTKVEPVVTPHNMVHEVFVPHDHPISRYREKIKGWEAKGWRIDSEAVDRTRMKVAYAIPSPSRRTAKGWVIDPVPLVPGDSGRAKQAAE